MSARLWLIAPMMAASAVQAAPAYDGAYDGMVSSSRYIRSYDGTRMAVTIYRPTSAGQVESRRLPVVVTQGRSDLRPATMASVRYFVTHGYVWVAQDRRGTGASFGVQTGFVNAADARDGKAVIEWSAAQPFATGKAVTWGCSNQGAWQYLALKFRPKGLVAIAPACSSAQFFDHGITLGGIPMLSIANQPYAGECKRPAGGARPVSDSEAARAQPVKEEPHPVDEDKDGALLAQARAGQACGSGLMGQYWRNMPRDGWNAFAKYRPGIEDTILTSAVHTPPKGVHVLQVGGWYDAAVAGQLESQRLWGGRLVMGPWVHGNRALPGMTQPNDTVVPDAEMLAWFDHYAKGKGTVRSEVLYYTHNAPAGHEWRRAAHWLAIPSRKQALYLGEDALSGAPSKAGPVLLDKPEAKLFDGQYAPLRRQWGGDMAGFNASASVHSGPVAAHDTEITGTPRAHLWISADRADANIYAVLEDVGPDGRASYISDGRLRASWRTVNKAPWGPSQQLWHRGYAQDLKPLQLGVPVAMDFDFFPISYVLKSGHRLRLAVTASIGEAYQAVDQGKVTLYRDRSSIELPVVARK
ncbi:CocE/NonD family hydrolase [Novosphingobium sediminicola]|uniref:Xaa-Pro dipeptidyl-peptidase C-terminal domain-containing protein n=1 Tax=Novosphingobium sediminicola TaxID=563162 RepID=A0A7W6CIY5_9SPHN|nr:hypothetical protein [Novosphingobium sediminicola]